MASSPVSAILLGDSFRHCSHPCRSSRDDRWSRCITRETFSFSEDTGALPSHSSAVHSLILAADLLIRRYAFRSTEKVALQEIGPRFTLKLRSLRKGLPAVRALGEPSKPLEFDVFEEDESQAVEDVQPPEGEAHDGTEGGQKETEQTTAKPPTEDEYQWIWKVQKCFYDFRTCTLSPFIPVQPELETTRRTFFL